MKMVKQIVLLVLTIICVNCTVLGMDNDWQGLTSKHYSDEKSLMLTTFNTVIQWINVQATNKVIIGYIKEQSVKSQDENFIFNLLTYKGKYGKTTTLIHEAVFANNEELLKPMLLLISDQDLRFLAINNILIQYKSSFISCNVLQAARNIWGDNSEIVSWLQDPALQAKNEDC